MSRWRDKTARKSLSSFLLRQFYRYERLYKWFGQLRTRIAGGSYRMWIKTHRLREADKAAIAAHIGRFNDRPLISILMPVSNAPADALRAAIESVRAQLYPHWELRIAVTSVSREVQDIVDKFANADSRIKVAGQRDHAGIASASNAALEMAQGQLVALLDQQDMLSEQALYQVVAELNAFPEADIFYTDEDKIFPGLFGLKGRRGDPHFKSSWNPDLLVSQNYVSNLVVYRAALVKSAGGFREGFEGGQDFDLLLRCLAARGEARVRHIPAVLYHARATPERTASQQRGHAAEVGIKALEDYFRTSGIDGVTVKAARFPATYHVRFPLPSPLPKVSLIIPSRNQHEVLRTCIDSIRARTTYSNYEIVVVDNLSDEDEALRYLDEIQKLGVRVLRYDKPFNYSAINNFAVDNVDGELIGLLNNDIEVISPDWLTEMVSHALRPGIGAVGAKLYYPNDTIQHGGVIVGLGGVAGHGHKHRPRDNAGYFTRLCVTQNLSAVTGACMIVRKDNYLRVGGLESEALTVAFNDVDFCLKLCEIGLRNVWTPHAELYHHESISRGRDDSRDKIARFKREVAYMQARWGERLKHDPYYNPMLTLEWETFTPDYRFAPRKPWLQDSEGR